MSRSSFGSSSTRRSGRCVASILLLCLAAVAPSASAADTESATSFELRDGDRVVLLGGTLIERAQRYGYLETCLTSRFPDRNATFRNLGWSGDTVRAESRAGFDTPAQGFARLVEDLKQLEPTVVMVAYGGNEAFDGEAGLFAFVANYKRLLDVISETGARVILLSPPRHEKLPAPLPDPAPHNNDLAIYTDSIRSLAEAGGHGFIDLYNRLMPAGATTPTVPLTDNGMHLTAYGYWRVAATIGEALELDAPPCQVEISANGETRMAHGAEVDDLEANGELRFSVRAVTLPAPPYPADAPIELLAPPPAPTLCVTGLTDGRYLLRIDGNTAAIADAAQWEQGVALRTGPDWEQAERLRSAIVAKNRLYFYRWRPQNITYLTGFRKHEQGEHADEVEKFIPLIAQAEAEIAELRVPAAHRYEIIPAP